MTFSLSLQGPQQKRRAATMAEPYFADGKRRWGSGGGEQAGGMLEGFILVMVIGLLVWKWDHSRKPQPV